MGDDLRIRDGKATLLQVPVGAARAGNENLAPRGVRSALLLQVRTEAGIEGSAYVNLLGNAPDGVITVLRRSVLPLLEGTDAADPEAVWPDLFATTRRAWWDREAACRAAALADAALWDVAARARGVPLHVLWGVAPGASLPAVVMAPTWTHGQDDAAAVAVVASFAAAGLGGAKLKVGATSPLGWRADAARVAAIRAAVGPEFLLMADANQAWSLGEAVRFADAVAALDLAWIEEPCHWEDDHQWLAELRRRTAVPVAAGQSELTEAGCRRLIEAGAVDVCNLDPAVAGATAWRRMAALAGARGVGVVCHLEPQLALQLAPAFPWARHIEILPPEADPFLPHLLAEPPTPRSGRIGPTSAPGWGLAPDPDFVRRHTAR